MKEARRRVTQFQKWYKYTRKELEEIRDVKSTYAAKHEYHTEMLREADKAINSHADLKLLIIYKSIKPDVLERAMPLLEALIKRLYKIEEEHYAKGDIDRDAALIQEVKRQYYEY